MSILPVSNEIASTMDLVILKWSELEQPCYYKLDEIRYVRSLFSENEPVPIGLINDKWYWLPAATYKYIKWIKETPVLLLANGKKKMFNAQHESWYVGFFYSYNSLMKQKFWDLEYGFCQFLNNIESVEHDVWLEVYNTLPQHATDVNFNLYIKSLKIFRFLSIDKLYISYIKIKKDLEEAKNTALNSSQNMFNSFANTGEETSYNLDNATVDIPPKLSRKRKMMKNVSFSNPEVKRRLDFSTDDVAENFQLNNASQELPNLVDAIINADTNI